MSRRKCRIGGKHTLSIFLSHCSRDLYSDRSGNLALSFAFIAVPLIIAIGCCLDYIQAVNVHRKMQSDLDAAVIAAVKQIGNKDDAAIKKQVSDWLGAQAEITNTYVLNASDISIDPAKSTVTAKASAIVPTTLLNVIGVKTIPVVVLSSVAGGKDAATKNAFSMYMVLDRSASMSDSTNTSYTTTCYLVPLLKLGPYQCTKKYSKIEALKLAVNTLTGQLSTADPDSKYVRTGAVSYNDAQQTPSPLDWGVTAVNAYVNNLTASGNTNSSDAMATAYAALMQPAEASLHKTKNGAAKPAKFIVLMTDGENTKLVYDSATRAVCDKARSSEVIVYTIAFMAPPAGQDLLKYCATTAEHYFAAEDTADLVEAFKVIGETSAKTLVHLTN